MLRLSFMHSLNMVQDERSLAPLNRWWCQCNGRVLPVAFTGNCLPFSIRQGFLWFPCFFEIYSCTSYYENTFFWHIFCCCCCCACIGFCVSSLFFVCFPYFCIIFFLSLRYISLSWVLLLKFVCRKVCFISHSIPSNICKLDEKIKKATKSALRVKRTENGDGTQLQ